ncbi:hypothetical protein [Asaia spathodeae]|uniref:hypothetical protein n=1 Tax=Asaia spathodeae TaxID=657016 RepID=UPI002265E158|nr:hypothetical protein [Asaia spathodeae]
MANLIMLCLECHKVVDELESRFSVEKMQAWKKAHAGKIVSLFSIPDIRDERELLIEVNDLLEENAALFRECGPYSENVLGGSGGDGLIIWKKRCLDTILPNNQKIIELIDRNKRNFKYPWELYRRMLEYKIHADAFQDNCLTDQKINDYKLFPRSFDYYVKIQLGIDSENPQVAEKQELEFRYNTVQTFIERFLNTHSAIQSLQELNRGTMLVSLCDGRKLKVFVTNTYFFTNYTLERVLEVDPAVDAIICASPAGKYTEEAKKQCIDMNVGLFMLGEFMGAINYSGNRYLNYLTRYDREKRKDDLRQLTRGAAPPSGTRVFVFGSFMRRKHYNDIDILIVYQEPADSSGLELFRSNIERMIRNRFGNSDLTIASEREFSTLSFDHDNLLQLYP